MPPARGPGQGEPGSAVTGEEAENLVTLPVRRRRAARYTFTTKNFAPRCNLPAGYAEFFCKEEECERTRTCCAD